MKRALVVEDEPNVAHLVTRLLLRHGLATTLARSRAEAFAILASANETFAIVYVDLGLADGSGQDVVNEIRRNGGGPPILVSTGALEHVRVPGATVLLRKPFQLTAFEEAVDKCLADSDVPTDQVRADRP
jgi:DNA-binding response OmpR family regulator